jgi:hypothetical protein
LEQGHSIRNSFAAASDKSTRAPDRRPVSARRASRDARALEWLDEPYPQRANFFSELDVTLLDAFDVLAYINHVTLALQIP